MQLSGFTLAPFDAALRNHVGTRHAQKLHRAVTTERGISCGARSQEVAKLARELEKSNERVRWASCNGWHVVMAD